MGQGSPQARGRSERMFSTLQERLPKELLLAGIGDIEEANHFIARAYLPAHNARFAKPPAIADSAFVIADRDQFAEILCIEDERIVGRDNTVGFGRLRLQLPPSPMRHHFVKAKVKVRNCPDGTLAIFHGPCCIGRYGADGTLQWDPELKSAARTASTQK